ncbi:MAG: barstar family protein [Psychrobacter sp.]|nr:barstar family protein [Psychrobacter sp.]
MTQAIYYINQSSTRQNLVKGKSSKAFANIPEQAIAIPIEEQLDKETLLSSLAKACDFPSWFGHNWDAAWDCLTDSNIEHVVLDLTAVKNINTEDFNVFKSIIEDAFKEFGKPQLWIVVASDDLS